MGESTTDGASRPSLLFSSVPSRLCVCAWPPPTQGPRHSLGSQRCCFTGFPDTSDRVVERHFARPAARGTGQPRPPLLLWNSWSVCSRTLCKGAGRDEEGRTHEHESFAVRMDRNEVLPRARFPLAVYPHRGRHALLWSQGTALCQGDQLLAYRRGDHGKRQRGVAQGTARR